MLWPSNWVKLGPNYTQCMLPGCSNTGSCFCGRRVVKASCCLYTRARREIAPAQCRHSDIVTWGESKESLAGLCAHQLHAAARSRKEPRSRRPICSVSLTTAGMLPVLAPAPHGGAILTSSPARRQVSKLLLSYATCAQLPPTAPCTGAVGDRAAMR